MMVRMMIRMMISMMIRMMVRMMVRMIVNTINTLNIINIISIINIINVIHIIINIKNIIVNVIFKIIIIAIEILESTLLDDRCDMAASNVHSLAQAGFRIELDNFGAGHAALSSLRRFPVHRIKIDRSLVHDIDRDAALRATVEGIALLADLAPFGAQCCLHGPLPRRTAGAVPLSARRAIRNIALRIFRRPPVIIPRLACCAYAAMRRSG